jgi:hypothetical protein
MPAVYGTNSPELFADGGIAPAQPIKLTTSKFEDASLIYAP